MRLGRGLSKEQFLSLPIEQQNEIVLVINATLKKHLADNSTTLAIRKTQVETGYNHKIIRHCMKQDSAIIQENQNRLTETRLGNSWYYWAQRRGVDVIP